MQWGVIWRDDQFQFSRKGECVMSTINKIVVDYFETENKSVLRGIMAYIHLSHWIWFFRRYEFFTVSRKIHKARWTRMAYVWMRHNVIHGICVVGIRSSRMSIIWMNFPVLHNSSGRFKRMKGWNRCFFVHQCRSANAIFAERNCCSAVLHLGCKKRMQDDRNGEQRVRAIH